ncbi:hypothetical protein STEG23_038037, partial [Scotinomys teguina]
WHLLPFAGGIEQYEAKATYGRVYFGYVSRKSVHKRRKLRDHVFNHHQLNKIPRHSSIGDQYSPQL